MSIIEQINKVNTTSKSINSTVNALKTGGGTALLKAAGLNIGNIFGISNTKIALIKMLGLNLEKFKNKPLAVLDSLVTSACPKVLTLKSGLNMIKNLMKNMNIGIGDMLKSTAFKTALNKAGIPNEVLNKVDINKCENIEDFTEQVTELGKGIIAPTINVTETITGLFKDPADFAKMFSKDKILEDALSEISGGTLKQYQKFFNTAGITGNTSSMENAAESDWK